MIGPGDASLPEGKFALEANLLADLWEGPPDSPRRRLRHVVVEFRCAADGRDTAGLMARICRTPRGPLLAMEVPARYSREQIVATKAATGAPVPPLAFPVLDLLNAPEDDLHQAHELRCRRHGIRAVLTRAELLAQADDALATARRNRAVGPRIIRL